MTALLSSSDDDLYAAVGEYLFLSSAAARPPTKRQVVAKGKAWVSEFHTQFQKAFCESKLIRYAQANPKDTVALLAAAAATIVKLSAIDLDIEGSEKALMALAALIVKEGIERYCSEPGTGRR